MATAEQIDARISGLEPSTPRGPVPPLRLTMAEQSPEEEWQHAVTVIGHYVKKFGGARVIQVAEQLAGVSSRAAQRAERAQALQIMFSSNEPAVFEHFFWECYEDDPDVLTAMQPYSCYAHAANLVFQRMRANQTIWPKPAAPLE